MGREGQVMKGLVNHIKELDLIDLEGAVGDVLATLAHAHHVLPNLLGGEGDACWEGGQA